MTQQYPNQPPFENGQEHHPQTFSHELIAAPSGWQSIPSPVRFAVWVWAIGIIVSLAGGALFAILMVLGVAASLGSLS